MCVDRDMNWIYGFEDYIYREREKEREGEGERERLTLTSCENKISIRKNVKGQKEKFS